MKKRIFACALAALLFSMMSIPALALIVYLEEGGTQWVNIQGTKWDITDYGRGGHAYQYLQDTGGNGYSSGKWKVNSGEPETTYWWWVWIPSNPGTRDAVVQYWVAGVTYSHPIVNQENYADQWVYLGGLTANAQSYLLLSNSCVSGYNCLDYQQVWWDDVMYQHP